MCVCVRERARAHVCVLRNTDVHKFEKIGPSTHRTIHKNDLLLFHNFENQEETPTSKNLYVCMIKRRERL